jgi:hypothetical protein
LFIRLSSLIVARSIAGARQKISTAESERQSHEVVNIAFQTACDSAMGVGIRVCKPDTKSGASLASRAGVSETTKQNLLERAAELVGYEGLASGLGVHEKTLKDWISGVSTMPDTKLRPLADLLTRVADSHQRTRQRFGMDDTARQDLFRRATDRLGHDEIGQRLNVPAEVIEAWMRGDVSLPDGKLLVLACVLEIFSRRTSEW